MIFGGFVTERTLRVICDEPDDPEPAPVLRRPDNDIPYRPQLKLSGTYPGPWGIQVSASLQSLAGRPIGGFTDDGFFVNKIQRTWLRRRRQPDRHDVVHRAHDALPGELPGAVSGRRAGHSRRSTESSAHRTARRAGHGVPAASQSARCEPRQVVRDGTNAPPGHRSTCSTCSTRTRTWATARRTSRRRRTCSPRASCRAASCGSVCRCAGNRFARGAAAVRGSPLQVRGSLRSPLWVRRALRAVGAAAVRPPLVHPSDQSCGEARPNGRRS